MSAPIAFIYGNCVFASGLEDAWAAFAVTVSSYGWLGEDAKHARLAIGGATRSERAGNITPAQEAAIKAKAKAALAKDNGKKK